MKRSEFFKSLVGLAAVASNPSVLAEVTSEVVKATPIATGRTVGMINKCYVSAIDPILDTRMVNEMIDKYGQDDYSEIVNAILKDKP